MSQHPSTIDPRSIKPFSVIRIPFEYQGDPDTRKRFVVVAHNADHEALVCIKATSQVALYLNNAEKMAGCVWYAANETNLFHKDTAIDPENGIALSYQKVKWYATRNELEICGTLPDDFRARLIHAVNASTTMSPNLKDRMLHCLG